MKRLLFLMLVFQFHLVRLKHLRLRRYQPNGIISIPLGPIEALQDERRAQGKVLFQFHLVRLKRSCGVAGPVPERNFNSTWSD